MHHALPVPLAVTASKERHRALDLGFARLVHFLIPVPARHQHALHVLQDLFKVHCLLHLHLYLVPHAPLAIFASSDVYRRQDRACVLRGLSPPWAVAQLQRARLVPQENIVSSAAPAPLATGHVLQALTPSKARAWLRVAFPVRPGDIALPVLPRFQDRVFVRLEHTPRRARV